MYRYNMPEQVLVKQRSHHEIKHTKLEMAVMRLLLNQIVSVARKDSGVSLMRFCDFPKYNKFTRSSKGNTLQTTYF